MIGGAAVLLLGIAALLIFVVFAGDDDGGGDGDGGESSAGIETNDLTKEEYIAEADAVCEEINQEIEEGAQQALNEIVLEFREPTDEEFAEIANDYFIPGYEDMIAELRELGAPAGDEEEIEEIVTGLETAVADLEERPEIVNSDDGIEPDGIEEALEASAAYGLDGCP